MVKVKAILFVLGVNLIYICLVLVGIITFGNKINLTKDALILTIISILLVCIIINFSSFWLSYDYFTKSERKKESILLVKNYLSSKEYIEVIPLINTGINTNTKYYALINETENNVEIYTKTRNKKMFEKNISKEEFIDFYKLK